MTPMRLHFALLICLLVSPLWATKGADRCATTTLPTEVQQLLASKYSDWRPKAINDLEEGDRRLWLAGNSNSCPGIAVGHFEQASQLAYAILLVPKSGESAYKVVVAAHAKNSGAYYLAVLDQGSATPNSGLVISRMPPGKQSGFDESKSVRLKLDGLNVEWIEKSSVLYYYSNGKYHTLQTSD